MSAIDEICHGANLGAAEMIFVSNIVSSQLLARTLFFVDGPEARAKLKRDSEDMIGGTLENACRHLTQSEQEMKSRIIMPH